MKNILLITNFYPPEHGGIQNYWHNLIKRLPSENAFVLTDKKPDSIYFDQSEPYTIFRKNFTSPLRFIKATALDLYLKTKSIVDKNNIELLIAGHFYLPALTCYLFKKIRGIPYIISTHGTEIKEIEKASKLKQKYMHKILQEAQNIIVTTDYMRNNLKKLGVADDKMISISPGVDYDFFKPIEQKVAREKVGEITDQNLSGYNILLSVGRLVERKGHDQVIKALPSILKKYPKTMYMIVGKGPHLEGLKMLSRKMNLENYVFFAGSPEYSTLPYFYNCADIFVMPSRTIKDTGDVEGFGIVYLEASACGKPIVAGNTGGVPEAIEDGKSGILVDTEKGEELRQALSYLIKDQYFSKQLGDYGRERVIKQFDWDDIVNKLKKII